ncbi:hypothetical protein EDB86DRAFT_2965594 [Lactarius hatsudake]|nr:hypothetical protein EDB86DRAFT_2965594 [Lactarius hatsudake]
MSRSQSSSNATPASVQVVTLTVTSSRSSTPTSQSSSGGSSSVPIAAIAGGTAGGVTLAVLLVLIWKYWGLVIKRDQRKKRKEARDMLTVRENTRRNASSGFKPQSQYRPMLSLNPDRRKVTFLTRGPAKYVNRRKAHCCCPMGHHRSSHKTPTSGQPPEDDNVAQRTEFTPTPAPTSPHIPATTITPISAPVAPAPVHRVHTQWSSPAPSAHSHPTPPSSTHGHAAPRVSSMPSLLPVPALPPVSTVLPPPLPAGAAPPSPPSAGPSSPPLWSITAAPSLRSSVLPASPDRPWAPPGSASEQQQQPVSPASSRPHIPTRRIAGEPSVRRGFLHALRHKPSAQAGGSANVRRTSTYSSASAYSND